jgi:predicted metalloprotease with PDZ domain
VLRRHKPGDTVAVEFVDRSGAASTAKVVLAEDPRAELVPVESTGTSLTPAQRAFRQSWLGR